MGIFHEGGDSMNHEKDLKATQMNEQADNRKKAIGHTGRADKSADWNLPVGIMCAKMPESG